MSRCPTVTKVKMSSWLLASGFILCGVLLAFDIAKFEEVFTELEVTPPPLTAGVFFVGPFGCLALTVLLAGGVVLNDLRFGSRILMLTLTLAMLAMVLYVVAAVFLPVLECPVGRLGRTSPNQSLERTGDPLCGSPVAQFRRWAQSPYRLRPSYIDLEADVKGFFEHIESDVLHHALLRDLLHRGFGVEIFVVGFGFVEMHIDLLWQFFHRSFSAPIKALHVTGDSPVSLVLDSSVMGGLSPVRDLFR
jgi:hypothetical protein